MYLNAIKLVFYPRKIDGLISLCSQHGSVGWQKGAKARAQRPTLLATGAEGFHMKSMLWNSLLEFILQWCCGFTKGICTKEQETKLIWMYKSNQRSRWCYSFFHTSFLKMRGFDPPRRSDAYFYFKGEKLIYSINHYYNHSILTIRAVVWMASPKRICKAHRWKNMCGVYNLCFHSEIVGRFHLEQKLIFKKNCTLEISSKVGIELFWLLRKCASMIS